MTTQDTMHQLWRRIDAWLLEQDEYAVEETLAPPASSQAIAELAAALGTDLPEALTTTLRIHDGCGFGDFLLVDGEWSLLGARQIVAYWKDLADHQAEFAEHDDSVEAAPGVRKRWWHRAWIPIAINGSGDHVLLDLAPAEGAQRGQLIHFWHDQPTRSVIAPSFSAWLSAFVAELEQGAFEYDEGVGLHRL